MKHVDNYPHLVQKSRKYRIVVGHTKFKHDHTSRLSEFIIGDYKRGNRTQSLDQTEKNAVSLGICPYTISYSDFTSYVDPEVKYDLDEYIYLSFKNKGLDSIHLTKEISKEYLKWKLTYPSSNYKIKRGEQQ